jgi:translocation and assembly module TamB
LTRWFATVVLSLVILAILLFLLIQTGPGRRWLASYIEARVRSNTGIRVELDRPTGWIPFDTRFGYVILSDDEGEWLRIDDLRIHLSPRDLLGGRFRFHEIAFADGRMSRYPVFGGEERSLPDKKVGSIDLPRLDIERFTAGSLTLEEGVAGTPAAMTMSGRYMNASPDDAGILIFNLRRTDSETLELDLKAAYDRVEPEIGLYAMVHEGEGGLFARLLGLPREGILNVVLDGMGTGSDWSGRLKATKGNLSLIDSDLDLSIGGEIALWGRGVVMTPPVWIPTGFKEVSDPAIEFLFATRFSATDQVARLDSLRLRHDELGSVHVSGAYVIKTSAIDVDAAFQSLRTEEWASILGIGSIGGLRAEANLSGTSTNPRGSLSLRVEGITDEIIQIDAASLDLDMTLRDTTGMIPPQEVDLSGGGIVDGLRGGDGRPLPEKRLEYTFSVNVPRDRPVDISKFTVRGEHTEIDLAGWLDRSGTGSVEASIRVKNIEDLLPALEDRFSGSALGRVSARGDMSEVSVEVRINGPGIDIEGLGGLKLPERSFHTRFRCTLPQLSILARGPDRYLDGSISLEGRLSGSFDTAEGRVDISGKNIRFDDREIGDLDGRLNLQDLFDRPRGDFALRIGEGFPEVKSRTDFLMDDGHLSLSGIIVEGLSSQFSGFLGVDLEAGGIEGEISGEVGELAELGSILKEDIRGKASVDARFDTLFGRQNAQMFFTAEKLVTRFGIVDTLNARVDLENIRESPSGTVTAGVGGLAAGELVLSSVSFDATGDLEQIAFDGTATGKFKGPLSIETSGRLERRETGTKLEVGRLQGMLGGERVALQSPLVFESEATGFSFQRFMVEIGEGRFEAVGIVRPDTVLISSDIRDLPMPIFHHLGVPNFYGSIHGTVQVDGKPGDPRVEASLQVTDLKIRDSSLEDLASSRLILVAQLLGGELNLSLDLLQPENRFIRGTITVPMMLSLHPFAYSLSPHGKLDVKLEGEFDLGRISPLFAPVDQRVTGRVNGDIMLTGSVSTPDISGRLFLSRGSYENITSGTVLKEIEMEAVAEGRRLEIRRFQATDGEKGTVSGNGSIDLDAGSDFPFELALEVANARLVHQDAITAVLDGRLTGSGTVVRAKLTGNLTAKNADVLIPEKLSSQVPTLNEVEIGGEGKGDGEVEEDPTRSQSRIDLDLTINLPAAVFVRGRGLDSEWKGDLYVTGELEDPVINGNLSVVRGRFIFFDKRFVLNEGAILFFGTVPPDPTIRVLAETRTGDLIINLLMTGQSSNLEISLESVPPLPSDELLARLLFGRNLSSITPIQALQLAQAVRTISGGGGTLDFMSRTRRLLSLDELEVRQEEEGAGTRIGVGKYVSEDVFIRVERNLASEDSRVMVEVELTPSLNLESDVGTDSRRGVGLNWKHDY